MTQLEGKLQPENKTNHHTTPENKDDDDESFFSAEDDLSNLVLSSDDEDALREAEDRALRGAPPFSPASPKKASAYKAYVVYCGRKSGVFQTWAATESQVSRWSGATYKGYETVDDARDAWVYALVNGTAYPSGSHGPPSPPLQYVPQLPQPPTSQSTKSTLPGGQVPSTSESVPSHPLTANIMDEVLGRIAQLRISPDNALRTTIHTKTNTNTASSGSGFQHHSFHQAEAGPSRTVLVDVWWVVLKGSHPGVYHIRSHALAALGNHPEHRLEKAGSLAMANQMFVNANMTGGVVTLDASG